MHKTKPDAFLYGSPSVPLRVLHELLRFSILLSLFFSGSSPLDLCVVFYNAVKNMGSVPSTPRKSGALSQDTAEYLIGTFVGGGSFPLSSEFWQKLLELPFDLRWPTDRVHQACEMLAKNNHRTKHLSKILFHLACYLQESMSASGIAPVVYEKAVNAVYITSIFLKHLIENVQGDDDLELHLLLDENESMPKDILGDYLTNEQA